MSEQERVKVIFVISTGEEAKLVYPIYKELEKRGVEVLNIETGKLCCGKNAMSPSEKLAELGMRYKSIYGYETKSMTKILRREKADVVVVGSDQEYIRRAFVYSAKKYNIPVLLLEVGISSNTINIASIATKRTMFRLTHYFANIVNKYLYLLRTVIGLEWGITKITKMVIQDIKVAFTINDARGMYGCDAIAIAGNWEREVLIERGVNPDAIYVTGNPTLNFSRAASNGETRQKLGIKTDDKVIALLTCAQVEHGRWTVDMREQFVTGIIDALSPMLGSVHLLIKVHPVEDLAVYKDIVLCRKENVQVMKDVVLADIIDASDLVIVGGYSTTVLEACALKKPVILPTIFNEVNYMPFAEMGLANEVYELGKLKGVVGELLYNQSTIEEALRKSKLFFDSNKEFTDGKATERISELILRL